MKKYFVTLILAFLCLGKLSAQDYPFDITYYPFVNYKGGKLIFSKDSAKFERIFVKLDSLIKYGRGKLNVVQIGASHTQADIFSNQLRMRLQTFHPGLVGARGFVFPYRMTKSNNPSNYIVSYSGFWTACRNVEWKRACELGISGASATTMDVKSTISVAMNPSNQVKYDFNEVKIFTQPYSGVRRFEIVPDAEMGNFSVTKIDSLGYIDIKFEEYQEVAKFHFEKTDSLQTEFTLYGFSLENDNPGVTYSALGINGASFSSWLGCVHFEKQLQKLNPDWFVIFLGVNDANTSRFDENFYRGNYETFIARVRKYCPNAVWTFVVPNDFYLFRRRPNPAMEREETVVKQLVEKYHESMFSIYDIMGGYGSSLTWVKNGLMAYDKVHMTAAGYTFCANMFFNAFLQSYSNYLDAKKRF